MSIFLHDLRRALRLLARKPAFTVVAVITLALGVGATTAIFTVLRGVVLDPLPQPDADRLVQVQSPVPGFDDHEVWGLSTAQYFFLNERSRTLSALGLYNAPEATTRLGGEPDRLRLAMVTPEVVDLVGASPALGRTLQAADGRPGATPVAVLSHEYWQRRFGGDPAVVGRTAEVFGVSFEIVGVTVPRVELPMGAGATPETRQRDLWIPFQLDPAGPHYNQHTYASIGRLAPGASLEEARRELAALSEALPEAYPQVYDPAFMERFGFVTRPVDLREHVLGDISRNLWILFGAVWIVLLVAAANVANLLLVRLESRRREIAVRAALGARRGALARHLLAEGAILSLAAGVLGVLLAWGGTAWLLSLAPETLPRIDNVTVGAGEVLFGLALSLGITLSITGLLALRRTPILAALGDEGRGATGGRERARVRGGLVAAQMALALVLVVGAGLLIESFAKLRAIDLGFDPEQTLALTVYLPEAEYRSMGAVWRFHDQLHERAAALPGVRAVGAGSSLPVESGYGCTAHGFEDAEVRQRLEAAGHTNCAGLVVTAPGYFEALGIPLLSGRSLTAADSDNPDRGAVVVSRAFAERFWPGEDPLGKGISPGTYGEPFYRVVGVVGDVPAGAADGPPAVAAYYPVVPIPERWGWQMPTLSLVLRADGADPGALIPILSSIARELDPAALVGNDRTMRSVVAASMSTVSFTMVLLGVAGVLSLVLAAVGLYGVVSHVVTARRREMGVRMALGARPRQVEGQVVGRAMGMVGAGLLLGVAGALAATRLLQGFLYEVEPTQPSSFLVAVLLLAAVALVASWLPARRAARVDPMIALRAE